MKKIYSSLFAVFLVFGLSAQNDSITESEILKGKNGVPVLPQSGDMAIGIDAMPFINFAGNFFGAAGAGTVAWDFPQNDQVFFLKSFINSEEAYRLKIRIGHNSKSSKFPVQDDEAFTSNPADYDPVSDDLEDKAKTSNTNLILMGGKEMRRGYGRLQGFMGAELGLMYTRESEKYEYSNDFGNANPNPSEGVISAPSTGSVNLTNERLIKSSEYTFGILGDIFVGAEYFFAPKMCIGGEFYWGIQYTALGKTKEEAEGWNNTVLQKETNEYENNNNPNTFNMDNNNLGGKLYLLFHF